MHLAAAGHQRHQARDLLITHVTLGRRVQPFQSCRRQPGRPTHPLASSPAPAPPARRLKHYDITETGKSSPRPPATCPDSARQREEDCVRVQPAASTPAPVTSSELQPRAIPPTSARTSPFYASTAGPRLSTTPRRTTALGAARLRDSGHAL